MISIRTQFIILFIVVTTLTLSGFSFYRQNLLKKQLNERFETIGQDTARRLQRNLSEPVWDLDDVLIRSKLESAMIIPDVHSIYLFSPDGKVLRAGIGRNADGVPRSLSSVNHEEEEPTSINIFPPGNVDAQRRKISIGKVEIFFSRDRINRALHDAQIRNISEVLVMDLLLVMMLTLSLRVVLVPLRKLRDALNTLASDVGEELNELPRINRTEFDEVIDGFNRTLLKLKQIIKRRSQAEMASREANKLANDALEQARFAQIKLEESNRQLEKLSNTDRLTGLCNRLKLDQVLEQELSRSNRFPYSFAVVMLDIDHFKLVNDTLGHQVGDRVLIEIANLMQSMTRSIDTAGRWGGEEFLVICPDTGISGAMEMAEKLRQAIAAHSFPIAGKLTASFGVASYCAGDTIRHMIARADVALYRSKNHGRNRVESEA